MAQILSKDRRVYVVDSDESNALLPRMLGAEPPRPLVEYLGGRENIFRQGEVNLTKALAAAGRGVKLSDLPMEYISTTPLGVRLLTIGKVRVFGEGCACPLNFLTRTLLKNMTLEEGDLVLVDTDAGMEHIGRGVEEGCDAVLAIADPTAESLVLANILKETTANLDKKFWLILNKATPEVVKVAEEKAEELGLKVASVIKIDKEVFKSGLEGGSLKAEEALADTENMLKVIGLLKS
jgi:CO dehydrogenase maturation factor